MFQGTSDHEQYNSDEFPFSVKELDAVIISHAHLDHSGRLPLLIKAGFRGSIYTHHATVELCATMLKDLGYIHEKTIKLWGKTIRVNASIHTIGGFSAHADQQGLIDWYDHFDNKP